MEHFDALMAEMSAAFLKISADQTELEIDRWLPRVGRALELDRITVGQVNPGSGMLRVTQRWAAKDVPLYPKNLNPNAVFPWLTNKIMADELVVLSRIQDAPREAAREVMVAERKKTRSAVIVPLKVGGVVIGAVAFDSVAKVQAWSPRTVRRMCLVTTIAGHALERRRMGSEIIRLQEEMRQLSPAVLMGELTASLAHELNQPIGAILNNAQAARRLLNAKRLDREELGDALDGIIRDDIRASDTVHHVREIFAPSKAQMASLDLTQVLLEVEPILLNDAKLREITLRFDFPAKLSWVVGSRPQLKLVLINLIINAFDSISDSRARERAVDVYAREANPGCVSVAVRDSGKGINPEIAPRLFDAFFTTKPNGMGMGLAIARSIIENHGGRLWARQNPDRGATMEFTLPIKAA